MTKKKFDEIFLSMRDEPHRGKDFFFRFADLIFFIDLYEKIKS